MILITLVAIFLLISLIKKLSQRSCYSSGEVSVSWQNQGGVSDVVSKWVLTINVDGETYSSENSSEVRDGDFVKMNVTGLPYKEEYNYNLSYQRIGMSRLVSLQEGTVSNNDMKFFSVEDLKSLVIYGPWVDTDKCSSQGKLMQERAVTRGDDDVTTEEREGTTDCCYQSDWGGDPTFCYSEGLRQQWRTVAGSCTGDDAATHWSEPCCYQSHWTSSYCENGTTSQTRKVTDACTGEDAYTARTASCIADMVPSQDRCGSAANWGKGLQCGGNNECCSSRGYCGTGPDYCNSESKTDYNAPEWTYS